MPLTQHTTVDEREASRNQKFYETLQRTEDGRAIWNLLLAKAAIKAMPHMEGLIRADPEKAHKHLQEWANWIAEHPTFSALGTDGKRHEFTGQEWFRLQVLRQGGDPDMAVGIVGQMYKEGAVAEISAQMDKKNPPKEEPVLDAAAKRLQEQGKDDWSKMMLISDQLKWKPGGDNEEPVRIRPGDSDVRKDLVIATASLEQGFDIVPEAPRDESVHGDISRAMDAHESSTASEETSGETPAH